MQAQNPPLTTPAPTIGFFPSLLMMVRQLFAPAAQPTPIAQMSEAAYLLMAGQALSYPKMDVAQRYLAIKAMVQVTDLFSSLLDTPRKEDLTVNRLGLGLEFKAAMTSKKSAPIDVPGWSEVDKAALLSTIDMSTAAGIALTEEINLISSQYAKASPVFLEHWENVLSMLNTVKFNLNSNHKRWSALYPDIKSNKEAVDDVFYAGGGRIRFSPPIAAPHATGTGLIPASAVRSVARQLLTASAPAPRTEAPEPRPALIARPMLAARRSSDASTIVGEVEVDRHDAVFSPLSRHSADNHSVESESPRY